VSVVIQVENLSKDDRLGLIGGGTLREDLHRWWAKTRGRPDPLLKIGQEYHGNREGGELWALRNVSF
jgi:lipopolysaccharide transport system ATP-binding protein